MIYPEFMKKGDTIGITAVSDGVTNPVSIKRLDNAIKNFNNRGFSVVETSDVRTSTLGKSADSKKQAMELIELYNNQDIKVIFGVSGGDFLLEMLPYVDEQVLQKHPKWLQGYSDITGLLFTITTNLDIATIYGDNFKAFGMKNWHSSLENNFNILQGNLVHQKSFPKYEKSYLEYITGDEEYCLDTDVNWQIITKEKKIEVSGRMLGGCIDVLSDLFGTKFDQTKKFIEKYKDDGIIWYFDKAELTNDELIRVLWKFKISGWFQYTKAILFSRAYQDTSYYGITYEQAIMHSLEELNIPIAIDCCFGHVAPRMTIINGSIAHIQVEDGRGRVDFELK